MPRGGIALVFWPSRLKELEWQGQKNDLPPAASVTEQPRCGHSAVKAKTLSSFWRTSQTAPIASGG